MQITSIIYETNSVVLHHELVWTHLDLQFLQNFFFFVEPEEFCISDQRLCRILHLNLKVAYLEENFTV